MSNQRPQHTRRRPSFKPEVDLLEDRSLLAASVDPSLSFETILSGMLHTEPASVSLSRLFPNRPERAAGVTFSTHALELVRGESTTYTVMLRTQPSDDVTLTISQDPSPIYRLLGIHPPTDEASVPLDVSPPTLTFTSTDWNQPQTVTVSAPVATAAMRRQVVLLSHEITSTDPNYDDLFVIPVGVFVHDPAPTNPGSLILSADHVELTRGATTSYTVKLASEPAGDVTVQISQEDLPHILGGPDGLRLPGPSRLTIAPSELTFNATTWDTPQEVTITVADGDAWLPVDVAVLRHQVESSDPNYNHIRTPPLRVVIHETPPEQPPGVRVSARTVVLTPRNNLTDSFRVALATRPTEAVTITISEAHTFLPLPIAAHLGGNAEEARPLPGPLILTVTPTTLTFTPVNWDQPQVVTISASDPTLDPAVEPTLFAPTPLPLLTFSITSTDPEYNNLWIPPVAVRIVDRSPPVIEVSPPVRLLPAIAHLPIHHPPPADNFDPAAPGEVPSGPGPRRGRRARRGRRRRH